MLPASSYIAARNVLLCCYPHPSTSNFNAEELEVSYLLGELLQMPESVAQGGQLASAQQSPDIPVPLVKS
ncbi:hypothetical protein OPV22_020207 [Ensete ventricosum]|uniref:Uncharacterized protein n=1 Tax=Ensete ventricosum TaxID=4639 RepID=A0AAV8PA00_ENSVE|nr:hypothetical protein OPV22_020207 [Ensete ventricosum]